MVGDGWRWLEMVGDGGRWWEMVGDGAYLITLEQLLPLELYALGLCERLPRHLGPPARLVLGIVLAGQPLR